MPKPRSVLAAAAVLLAAPAQAAELFGGLYVHDVDTPLTKSGVEKGTDLQLGVRGGRIAGTPLQPYAFIALNSAGDTHYGAVGLSARFGDQIYLRPGLGLALHSGSASDFDDPTDREIEFGSRILFAPELAVGARLNERLSIEASWIHLSHGQLLGRQNPGMDSFGVRLNFDF